MLFFWMARMIMLGCHFMLDVPMPDGSKRTLADAVPFREVYIHALVRDADRQKMSKTKGNVIDPIDIIHRYGTDAVRFTLASMASPGTDIAFSEARTEGYRAFANKIWNAARFIFMQMDRAKEAGIPIGLSRSRRAEFILPDRDAPLEDHWIAACLNQCAADVNQALADYRFDDAANRIYQFFWGEFCDWYLEIVKLRMEFGEGSDRDGAAQAFSTLIDVFEAALRLLSPFMPFLTEEIWHALYERRTPQLSIALAQYPEACDMDSQGVVSVMAMLQSVISDIRNLRKEQNVPEREPVPVWLYAADATRQAIGRSSGFVRRLAKASELRFSEAPLNVPGVRQGLEYQLAIEYSQSVDGAAERERLAKDLAKYEKEMQSKQSQLQNGGFLAKAPAKIVDGLRTRADELTVLIEKTRAALDSLDTVGSR